MIRFLARIALSAAMPLAILHPQPGHAAAPSSEHTAHISIEAIGKGAPVILIPGLSSPRAVWDGVAPGLASDHRVILVQVNGFGGGDPGANTQPGILEGVVGDLDSYITRNKLQGAAVVGHSMGGLVALMLAHAHPADVGKLMVVDSLPYVGDIFLPGATVAQVEPQAKAMRDREVASYGRPANDAAASATANTLALKPDSRAKVAAWFKQADPRVSGEAMYEDMTTDLRPDMTAIATPITLVYPWSDQLPKDRADAFYKAEYAKAPNVTFVPVGDSAHFVMLDQPAAFQAALDAFLAK
ncbi:alpha/beta fold hydrolase [Hephaestia mangrovi]|uniref:alpha/beta fold hydrolase n=1 Tax=Hephaestia mangrovi TaxID=2873268 RepID=UPI001CA7AF9E|nr:alpha/beta hydrolase [Hephaestia mangrovi]MBY8829017.1 alpha/beta hydrolase [Hephaestia mangrovi]